MNYPQSDRYLPNYDNWFYKDLDDLEPSDQDLLDQQWKEDVEIDQLQPPFDL